MAHDAGGTAGCRRRRRSQVPAGLGVAVASRLAPRRCRRGTPALPGAGRSGKRPRVLPLGAPAAPASRKRPAILPLGAPASRRHLARASSQTVSPPATANRPPRAPASRKRPAILPLGAPASRRHLARASSGSGPWPATATRPPGAPLSKRPAILPLGAPAARRHLRVSTALAPSAAAETVRDLLLSSPSSGYMRLPGALQAAGASPCSWRCCSPRAARFPRSDRRSCARASQ